MLVTLCGFRASELWWGCLVSSVLVAGGAFSVCEWWEWLCRWTVCPLDSRLALEKLTELDCVLFILKFY